MTATDQNQKLEHQIAHGLEAAFIDRSVYASETYQPRLVTNNYREGKKVSSVLEEELEHCKTYIISVAFITWAGLTPLLESFKELRKKGIQGRVLTTDYQMFSEPKALRFLAETLHLDVRMYRTDHDRNGFHTKGYIFGHGEYYTMIVGSSNLTTSALSTNQEWNVRIVSTKNGEFVEETLHEFEELWNSPHTEKYEQFFPSYKEEYALQKRVSRYVKEIRKEEKAKEKIEPNQMQDAFLKNLAELQKQGKRRALLISATGTGKTYASAFAVRQLKPHRMLFLVHREQIAEKARQSYQRVLGGSDQDYGLLSGTHKDTEVKYLFATVETMAKKAVYSSFAANAFDVIIIDEAHHSSSASYQRLMDYFTPKFWLGMTGSPDRADQYDIYDLFDNNIACEIRLQQALEENMLCPFHYFGITDETDDEGKEVPDNKDRSLEALTADSRVENIIHNAEFFGYSGDVLKGLIFCSRKDEGKKLSEKFNRRGYRTVFLSGDDSQTYRQECVDRLVDEKRLDKLDYIISVDIFNEGIDIPEVNQVIFLRPTQSPVVFIQQMGRGLRKADGKEFVVILDFIGNYTNNYMIPIALSGDRSYNKDNIRRHTFEGSRSLPGASTIHFDEIARERIFHSIDHSHVTASLKKEKYKALKAKLNRIPTIYDFYQYGDIDPQLFISKDTPSYDTYVRKVDGDDYTITFTKHQETILAYVTAFLMNGMRPHELLMIQMIMDGMTVTEDTFRKVLQERYPSCPYRKKDYVSAIRILQNQFIKTPQDIRKYGDVRIISENGKGAPEFLMDLLDGNFRMELQLLLKYSFQMYEDHYLHSDENNLALYQKYTRKDICRLLDWPSDDSNTIYGYKIAENTCPIFITYQKQENVSRETRYNDRFLSNEIFSWMTRHKVKLDSKEVQAIMHAEETGMKILLFIKKNDYEGSAHYYLGEVTPAEAPVQKEIVTEKGKKEPIVNILFRLQHPVREDLYEYITA